MAEFDTPVYVTALRVRESFRTGFVKQVALLTLNETEVEVWAGFDDNMQCPGWFSVDLPSPTPYLSRVVVVTVQNERGDTAMNIDAFRLEGYPVRVNPPPVPPLPPGMHAVMHVGRAVRGGTR